MNPESVTSSRNLSLDVFRGLTIAGMILVNSPGNEVAYWPLDHAAWNGLTPTDLVFPFFVFIVGMSLVMSLSKRIERGDSRRELLAQVLKRSLLIFALGLVLNGFPYYHLSTVRILGVLQRISLCYFFGSLFFLFTPVVLQIVTAVALVILYHAVMLHTPVPGWGIGNLTKEGNLAAYVDRALLSGHMYRPVYDPEGLLSTLPAIASVLFGNLAGVWFRGKTALTQKLNGYVQAGAIFCLIGLKWNRYFPINKALWSSSYVVLTTGLAAVVFGLCLWLVDIRGWKRWTKPFEALGRNAILAYFLHVFFLKVQNLIKIYRPDGSMGNLRFFITDHCFLPWLSAPNASLAYALLYTLFWIGICGYLYKKKLFFKV